MQALTTGDIAQHCGVNFRTVIRRIDKGHLKATSYQAGVITESWFMTFCTFFKNIKCRYQRSLETSPSEYWLWMMSWYKK
jgi:hypothetical protein